MVRRLSTRDRFYADVDVVRVIGPLATPPAGAVRAALAGMHADRPGGRAVSRLDRAAGRWRPAGGTRDLVLELDPGDGPDAVAARMAAEPLGDRPLLLGTGGAYAALRFNHALGDGRVAAPMLLAALTAAGTPVPYPYLPGARLPLLRALANHFGRHPGRLPSAARISRPPPGVGTGVRMLPWRPALAHHWSRSVPGGGTRLRRWRDTHAPGASTGAVLAAALTVAFGRHLPGLDRPGVMMLVDARRYLPAGTPVAGNFAAAEYLEPADPADPVLMHALISARLAAGAVLATMALHHARLLLPDRRRGVPVTSVPARPRARLTLTYLGRVDRYAALPWLAGPGGRRMTGVITPDGPQGVTVAVEEFGDVLHATTTYHGNVFHPAAVAAATDALTGDPADLF